MLKSGANQFESKVVKSPAHKHPFAANVKGNKVIYKIFSGNVRASEPGSGCELSQAETRDHN
tara:strand:- start:86 stop:271 length:186 start_codon:yes stop_codon:yes gene_type:complete